MPAFKTINGLFVTTAIILCLLCESKIEVTKVTEETAIKGKEDETQYGKMRLSGGFVHKLLWHKIRIYLENKEAHTTGSHTGGVIYAGGDQIEYVRSGPKPFDYTYHDAKTGKQVTKRISVADLDKKLEDYEQNGVKSISVAAQKGVPPTYTVYFKHPAIYVQSIKGIMKVYGGFFNAADPGKQNIYQENDGTELKLNDQILLKFNIMYEYVGGVVPFKCSMPGKATKRVSIFDVNEALEKEEKFRVSAIRIVNRKGRKALWFKNTPGVQSKAFARQQYHDTLNWYMDYYEYETALENANKAQNVLEIAREKVERDRYVALLRQLRQNGNY